MDLTNLNMEERLRQAAPKSAPDQDFQYRLRRALLNSKHWTEPHWVRWLSIFRRWALLATSAVAVGFFLAITPRALPTPAVPTPATLTVQNSAAIQELEEQGRLRYVGQSTNGVRIYEVNLADGMSIELHDPAPYTIQLTHQ